ncbi:hypothetical protein BH23THE1_BH23THE1_11090 [soil metagenome]
MAPNLSPVSGSTIFVSLKSSEVNYEINADNEELRTGRKNRTYFACKNNPLWVPVSDII